MTKASDYIINFLYRQGIKDVFLVTGGGVIHLDDSVGKSKMQYICNHHEQASAMAAEAYARLNCKIGFCLVTTGPGGTNALTGLLGGWLDSIPMLFISGQIRRETIGAGTGLRQLGDQEINIVDIVKPMTKYAVTIMEPHDIRYHLEKALFLAKDGRPGPIWLDIPMDIQGAYIDEKKMKHFNNTKKPFPYQTDKNKLRAVIKKIVNKINKAERPVLFVGNGIRLAEADKELLILINTLKIPVLTGFAGYDLVSPENPYFAGRPGTVGQRYANFTLQNSDLLLVIGSRLNIRMIGYNYKSFAREAYKIIVDVDKGELNKKTIKPDLKINYDAKDFIVELIKLLHITPMHKHFDKWLDQVHKWQKKYPVVQNSYSKEKTYINPYYFTNILSQHLKFHDIIAVSDGTAEVATYQALSFPQGTRIIANSGCAAMGYGLPAAIGLSLAANKKPIICIEGDGSLQLNIQELQTIVHYNLPIKIFVYNNQGYVSIRLTQKNMFEGRLMGSGKESGVTLPNLGKIAKAYGLPFVQIKNHNEITNKLVKVLGHPGPIICEVLLSPDMEFLPRSSTKKLENGSFVSRPLEDMYPFLDEEELKNNMIIPLVGQDKKKENY